MIHSTELNDFFKKQLADILEAEINLSDWECDFVDSLMDRLSESLPLTGKQAEILSKLHQRIWTE